MSTQTNATSNAAAAETYVDRNRFAWLLYPLWTLTPIIGIALGLQTGQPVWFWLTPLFIFIAMPILDLVLGSNTKNAPDEAVPRLESDPYYSYVVRSAVGLHYLALIAGAWAVATQGLAWFAYIPVALSCGLISAWGIVTSHELGHKKNALDRWLSKITLATGAYGCYMTDHNVGHHRDVATPEDSGTARFGENLYYFLIFRQFPHSAFIRPLQLEKQRLARSGKSAWSLENQYIQSMLVTIVAYGALIAAFGAIVIPYLLMVAFTSYFFLGFIDYIEHYGLLRAKLANGRYERPRPEHSWNTDHVATNIIYLHAQRHSDHHAWPTRRYQVLRSFPGLPTMPTGYPGMYWLSIIPPLWRAVMYPKLLKLHDYDLNRINVDPRQRAALFAKYSRVPDQSVQVADSGAADPHVPDAKTTGTANQPTASAHQCPGCGYIYRDALGEPEQGFAAGTPWAQIPADWACPDCAVRDKVDFVDLEEGKAA